MTDLVERLREWQFYEPKAFGREILKDVAEAADEIELMRDTLKRHAGDVKDAMQEIELLRERAAALDGNRPLPYSRDELGRMVREAWVRWAQTQPYQKPTWLVPYDKLPEPDKEADRQIGEAIARWTLIGDAASALPTGKTRECDTGVALMKAIDDVLAEDEEGEPRHNPDAFHIDGW